MNQLYKPLWFVVHFTGGTPNLQSLYNYWISQCGVGSNSHFGIERTDNQYAKAGDIWQFLDYTTDGACANCCLESGYAPFLPNINLNVRTISCEGINPSSGNLGNMPQAQFDSYAWLIRKVCYDMEIPTTRYTEYYNGYETTHTWADASGGIIMHRDIAPTNRRMCPGDPYYTGQMDALIKAVNSGSPSPGGNYMQEWGSKTDEMVNRMWECHYYDTANMIRYPFPDIAVPRKGTGIFNKWKELLVKNNKYLGGVCSEEYGFSSDTADYAVQNFTAGQMRYNKKTGAIDWIDCT